MPSTMYVGFEWVVGRDVSKQPPWSIATSMITAPCFISLRSARVTRCGAPAPVMSAAPLLRTFEVLGPFLNAHAAGDFAHRSETGQPPVAAAQRLVRHRRCAGVEHALRQFFVGGEMKIGEDDLPRPQQRPFGRLGFLHLNDEVGPAKDF